jgi:hypothetical protein
VVRAVVRAVVLRDGNISSVVAEVVVCAVSCPETAAQQALSVTQRALSVTQPPLSVTQYASRAPAATGTSPSRCARSPRR